VLLLPEEQQNMKSTWLCPGTPLYTMFKIGHTWARLEGLGEPLGSTVNPPQTKSGGSVFGQMAQFARIMYSIWSSGASVYTCSKGLAKVGGFHYINYILHCSIHNHWTAQILLLFRLKINNIMSCNSCAFILVLGVGTNIIQP
jgi:hypothetical protein